MPRYFFHVIDGSFIVDNIGIDCESMREVRIEAIKTSAEILRDVAGKFPAGLQWQMHVTDETKRTVLKLSFAVDEPVEAA